MCLIVTCLIYHDEVNLIIDKNKHHVSNSHMSRLLCLSKVISSNNKHHALTYSMPHLLLNSKLNN